MFDLHIRILCLVPDSPRQISTYLYDKSEEDSQSYDNSTPSSSPAGGITEAEVRERAKNYTKPISPYCTVELSAGQIIISCLTTIMS